MLPAHFCCVEQYLLWLHIGVAIALWAPIISVYFMDTQTWYAICLTLIGGIYGACRHLGEIRTLGMLRSLPKAFNQCLIPSDTSKKRGFQAPFSSTKPSKTPEGTKEEEKVAARFAQIWNLIITSFREEDLISNSFGLSPGSRAADEKNYFNGHLAPFCRIEQLVLATSASSGSAAPSIVNDNNMKLLFQIQKKVASGCEKGLALHISNI